MAMAVLGTRTKTEKYGSGAVENIEAAMSEEEYFGEVYDEVLSMLLSEAKAMERVNGRD